MESSVKDKALVIEFEKMEDLENLQKALKENFGSEIDAELIERK